MGENLTVDLSVEVEVDSDELEIEIGNAETAETELSRDGLSIEVEAEISRTPSEAYEEPEFDDSATDETVAGLDSDVESMQSPEDED